MFRIIKDDFGTLSWKRLTVKYSIYLIFFSSIIILCCQLIAQLFTANQLNKITGSIISKSIEITSYTGGSRTQRGYPNHSLIVLLKNNKTYNIDLDDGDWEKYDILHKGDQITFYYPSVAYRLLSLDYMDFDHRVSQVEFRGKILYSFKQHQHAALRSMLCTVFLILLSTIGLFNYHTNK